MRTLFLMQRSPPCPPLNHPAHRLLWFQHGLARLSLRLPRRETTPLRLQPHPGLLLPHTSATFFGGLHKSPDQVSPQDVFSFAHGPSASQGVNLLPVTVGARLSCISSFFKFLIRMDVVRANPCDPVERPKPRPGAPSGLSASADATAPPGHPRHRQGQKRDLAIVLTLVLTGRRRSEVVNLTAGDIAFDESAVFYRYVGKGGVRGRRELPCSRALGHTRSLGDVGKDLSSMQPSESLWQAGAGLNGVSSATFYNRFRGYLAKAGLPPSGVHRPTPHRRQAPPRRRRVGRVREPVPRSQLARSHHHLSPSASKVSAIRPGMASPTGPRRGLVRLAG